MISKEKLINDILQNEQVLSDANYIFRSGYMERQNEIIDIINAQPVINADEIDELYLKAVKENAELKKQLESNGRILADEQLPKNDDYILLSFEDFSVVMIGRYETDEDGGGAFYVGDDDCSCSSCGLFVCAWQPCPTGYIPKGKEERYEDLRHGWKKSMMNTFLGSRRGDI